MNAAAARETLLALILERAYREGDFTLSSGRKSRYYVNSKPVLLDGAGSAAFAVWVLDDLAGLAGGPPRAVGGLELGAVPPAVAIATLAAWRGDASPPAAFIVRKAAKGHGTAQRIEGALAAGDRVVVLDDVITTGASTLQAIDAVEAAGATVVRVYCLVDRREEHDPRLDAYVVRAAFRLADITAAAAARGGARG